ncbi:sensor histidine kinase [Phenylobacterium kunshanense]|uniref:Signal transduction histidine kinase LytS n=1 Tax=Phenylobacterium kunshanense TaxID=1445034 RepID=A0A328BQV6_9CAUL|nr:histidine kinase [Phenylobacterium kunshanense]RAK68901.1 signal transduction histidine kinase LytS [Phenylobacterium kunshanense]
MKIDLGRSATGLAVGFAGLLWFVAFIGYVAPGVAAGNYGPRNVVYLGGSSLLGAAFSVLFYLQILATHQRSLALRGLTSLAVLAGLAGLHAWVDLIVAQLYLGESYKTGPNALVSGEGVMFLNNLLYLTPTHVTYAAALGMGFSLRAVAEREQRLARALAAAQEAQLAALRFQINPHFLFNSLNAVMSLVGAGRNRDAETVVARLAEFFRATLSNEPNAMVTLEEEFDLLGAYLDIEAARFGDRLNVVMELPPRLSEARTPHLLLQPLAENAIKHAVAPSKRPVTIRVSAKADSGRLHLEVSDDGSGEGGARAGLGVGLGNVAARLTTLYGDKGRLSVYGSPTGFSAEVTLPLAFSGAV